MKLKLLFFPLSVVIALFLFIYFIKPTFGDFSSNRKILDDRMVSLSEIQKNKNSLDGLLVDFNSMDSGSKILIQNAITYGISEEEFIYDLSRILKDTGVKLEEVAFSAKDKFSDDLVNESVEEANLDMLLSGNYFQLKKALYLIENMNRFVRIKDLNISLDDSSGGLELSLEAAVFYKKEKSNLQFEIKDLYLTKLLVSGMNLNLVDEYKKYRGDGYEFDFSIESGFGNDNLFGTSEGSKLDIETEIANEGEEENSELEVAEDNENEIEEPTEEIVGE